MSPGQKITDAVLSIEVDDMKAFNLVDHGKVPVTPCEIIVLGFFQEFSVKDADEGFCGLFTCQMVSFLPALQGTSLAAHFLF